MGDPNPLRHRCIPGQPNPPNCFNRVAHPKIGDFAPCFSGKIAMSNIDASVEVNGHVLFMEWKRPDEDISYGQKTMFERMVRINRKITVMAIRGDPETMVVVDRCIFRKYVARVWEPATIESIKHEMRCWNTYAENGGDGALGAIRAAIEAKQEAENLLRWSSDSKKILNEFSDQEIAFLNI